MRTCERARRDARTVSTGAFSLAELVAVLSILVILASRLAVTSMEGAATRAAIVSMRQQALTATTACEAYRRRYGAYPACVGDLYAADLLSPRSLARYSDDQSVRLLLVPSSPGRQDIASARVLVEVDTSRPRKGPVEPDPRIERPGLAKPAASAAVDAILWRGGPVR